MQRATLLEQSHHHCPTPDARAMGAGPRASKPQQPPRGFKKMLVATRIGGPRDEIRRDGIRGIQGRKHPAKVSILEIGVMRTFTNATICDSQTFTEIRHDILMDGSAPRRNPSRLRTDILTPSTVRTS
jgi:hypothetical protein